MKARGALAAGLLVVVAVMWMVLREDEAAPRLAQLLEPDVSARRTVVLPDVSAGKEKSAAPPVAPAPVAPHFAGFVVRKSDGSPLAGAQVMMMDEPHDRPEHLLDIAHADAAGCFDLPVEAPLEHAVLSIGWSAVARWLEDGHESEVAVPGAGGSTRIALQPADFTTGVPRRIELDTGWIIGGTVTDGHGGPVHAARLVVDEVGVTAESALDGSFLLRDVPPGRAAVSVTAHAPGRVTRTVEVSAPPAGQDRAMVVVELPECASLRGVVVHDSGAPLDGVTVCLVGADQLAPGPFLGRTGPDGSFAFSGVPEGRFDLVAGVDEDSAQRAGALDAAAETWVHDVLLACGAEREVRLTVANGVSQRGRVVDDKGRPLTHHLVVARAVRDPPCHPSLWFPAASAETDSTGTFALRRLAPGPWELTVEGHPDGCAHGDGFLWRPLATRGTRGATAQDGPVPGPPRPVEARREVEVAHVANDVELVVPPPSGSPETSLARWPELTARLVRAAGFPMVDGRRMEIFDGFGGLANTTQQDRQGMFNMRLAITSESAAGLLAFSGHDCLTRYFVLHDAQLEHEFGEVVLDEAPAIEVRVRAEDDESPAAVMFAVHWFGGGRAEWVDVQDGHWSPTLRADRRQGQFELTVSAPGYRRWRQAGVVPASREPLKLSVELQRW